MEFPYGILPGNYAIGGSSGSTSKPKSVRNDRKHHDGKHLLDRSAISTHQGSESFSSSSEIEDVRNPTQQQQNHPDHEVIIRHRGRSQKQIVDTSSRGKPFHSDNEVFGDVVRDHQNTAKTLRSPRQGQQYPVPPSGDPASRFAGRRNLSHKKLDLPRSLKHDSYNSPYEKSKAFGNRQKVSSPRQSPRNCPRHSPSSRDANSPNAKPGSPTFFYYDEAESTSNKEVGKTVSWDTVPVDELGDRSTTRERGYSSDTKATGHNRGDTKGHYRGDTKGHGNDTKNGSDRKYRKAAAQPLFRGCWGQGQPQHADQSPPRMSMPGHGHRQTGLPAGVAQNMGTQAGDMQQGQTGVQHTPSIVNPMMNPMMNPMINPMMNPMMNPMINPMMNPIVMQHMMSSMQPKGGSPEDTTYRKTGGMPAYNPFDPFGTMQPPVVNDEVYSDYCSPDGSPINLDEPEVRMAEKLISEVVDRFVLEEVSALYLGKGLEINAFSTDGNAETANLKRSEVQKKLEAERARKAAAVILKKQSLEDFLIENEGEGALDSKHSNANGLIYQTVHAEIKDVTTELFREKAVEVIYEMQVDRLLESIIFANVSELAQILVHHKFDYDSILDKLFDEIYYEIALETKTEFEMKEIQRIRAVEEDYVETIRKRKDLMNAVGDSDIDSSDTDCQDKTSDAEKHLLNEQESARVVADDVLENIMVQELFQVMQDRSKPGFEDFAEDVFHERNLLNEEDHLENIISPNNIGGSSNAATVGGISVARQTATNRLSSKKFFDKGSDFFDKGQSKERITRQKLMSGLGLQSIDNMSKTPRTTLCTAYTAKRERGVDAPKLRTKAVITEEVLETALMKELLESLGGIQKSP